MTEFDDSVSDEELDLPVEDDLPDTDEAEVDTEEEIEAEESPDDGGDDDPAPKRSGSRAQSRIASLANENKRLKDEFESFKQQVSQQIQQPRIDPAIAAQQEQERLAYMTVEERAEYQINKARTQMGQEINGLKAMMADTADKSDFQAKCATNRHYAKVAQDVEKALQIRRANGFNDTREAIATWIIGAKVVANASKQATSQKAKARQNVRRETVAAQSGRGSDVGASRERGGKTAKQRLLAGDVIF